MHVRVILSYFMWESKSFFFLIEFNFVKLFFSFSFMKKEKTNLKRYICETTTIWLIVYQTRSVLREIHLLQISSISPDYFFLFINFFVPSDVVKNEWLFMLMDLWNFLSYYHTNIWAIKKSKWINFLTWIIQENKNTITYFLLISSYLVKRYRGSTKKRLKKGSL